MHRKTPDRCVQDGLHERLATFGPAAASDAELVHLVLGSTRNHSNPSLAYEVLATLGPPTSLQNRRLGEFTAIRGMTPARARRLLAAVELGRRVTASGSPMKVAQSADDVAQHCSRLATEPDEVFVALSLNARNKVIGEWTVARGWESGVNLTARKVYTLLVKEGAFRVVFVHNHPSGDPSPSAEDIRFTIQLLEASKTLNIKILDHVIVASDGFTSLRETASLNF